MSKFEKFKSRIMQGKIPRDITCKELQSFMIQYGFELNSKSGSHYTYKHEGLDYLITIPMHDHVKFVYIKDVRDAIQELEGK